MKKGISFILFFLLFSTAVYSETDEINRSPKEFTGSIGTGYSSNAGKYGLDLGASYLYALDKLFAAGCEVDFFWINWKRELGTKEIGQTTAIVKAETNAYNIPIFFNAQMRYPFRMGKAIIEPGINIGLGWDFMILQDSIPSYQKSTGENVSKESKVNIYHNYAWQVLGSVAYKPETSTLAFLLALGYRGMLPSSGGIEFNMSGFLMKFGVRFYL